MGLWPYDFSPFFVAAFMIDEKDKLIRQRNPYIAS